MGMHSFAESSNLGERSNSAVRFSNLQRGGAVTPPRAHSSAQRSNSAQRSDSARVCNSALSCKRTHTPKRKARAKSPVRESMERADHDRLDNADQAPVGSESVVQTYYPARRPRNASSQISSRTLSCGPPLGTLGRYFG